MPSCVAVSSIVGGVIAATTADLAWKVGANACRTSSLFSEAQVSSHVPKKPEAKKSKGNTKTHNALLRVASTPTTATSYEEFSNTQLNRKIIETLLVEDTAEKDIERHSTLKISTAFEVVNSWLDDESIPTETRLNYANVLAKSTHSHLSTVSDGMYDIHLIAFTDKLNDTAEEIKALQLNLNEKKLTLSEFKHAFKKQVDASDKTTRDFINEKPKDPLSLENLLERFNNTAESEKQLHLMRDELITAIEEISGDEEALRAKADLITQRYKFEEIKSNAHLLTTGASSLAVIFGHPEWANKISAVGHGSVSITESILALAGSSLVSITSPMAIVGILSSIASITQAFSPQYQDPTPQLTLEAVQELSRQLARLEDKIYYHFQEQKLEHKETYRKTLEHFSQLHTSNAIQLSMTRQFYMSIQARFDQQESQLNSLPQLIHAMSERMIYAAYDTQHNDLIECMNFIEAMTETAETNYLENATKILTIGLHNSIGSQPSSPMDIPSLPVSPNSYLHFSTYFAQLMHTFGLSNCNTKFADPYLATTAALVALLLDIKQFPDPNHPHEHLRINEKSVNRLLEYLSMLTRISNLMIQSREPAFFENVLAAWRKATLQLDSEIRVAFRSIIKERQHFYQQELGVVLDIQRAMIEEGFINTHIEPSVQELFTGTIKRWKRRHHGRTWDVRGNEHVGSYIDEEAKNAFLIPLKSQINQQKIIAKEDSVTRQLVVSENKMSVDGHWAITHYHGIKYIKPNEPGLPYLPAPDPLFSQEAVPAFLKTLLKAQTFSVGELQLTYDIDLATSTFHLHLEMQCLDDTRQHLTSQRIATFTRPYAPLYAQGAEAVWYFWLGGSLPRSNTKIAKHRLIDATLMHGGWFPLFAERTGQEMCDFAWQHHGGGLLGHDGGEFEFTQVSYFINDACVDFPATKDIFVTMSEAALPPNVTLTVYPEPLQIISDLMKTQETRFKNDCADRLSQTLRGKNFKQYELSFRNLYGILSWSYYNTLQNPDSRLSKCFSQTVFNLDEICNKNTASIREGNPLISSYNSLKNLAEISAELRETLKDPEFGLPDPNCAFLTEAARQINAFLALYLPNFLAGDQMATLSKANEIAMTLIVETLASILQEQHSEAGQRILMGMAKKVEELIATSKPADRTLFVEMLRSKLPTKAISWTGGLFRIKNASEAAPSQEHHTSHTQ